MKSTGKIPITRILSNNNADPDTLYATKATTIKKSSTLIKKSFVFCVFLTMLYKNTMHEIQSIILVNKGRYPLTLRYNSYIIIHTNS